MSAVIWFTASGISSGVLADIQMSLMSENCVICGVSAAWVAEGCDTTARIGSGKAD